MVALTTAVWSLTPKQACATGVQTGQDFARCAQRGTVMRGGLLEMADEIQDKEINALAAITEP
jgi:hypothetical protein